MNKKHIARTSQVSEEGPWHYVTSVYKHVMLEITRSAEAWSPMPDGKAHEVANSDYDDDYGDDDGGDGFSGNKHLL